MLDYGKISLHEMLEMCANKARGDLGEGRAFVYFQEMLEAAAQFSAAHYEGDERRMFDAAGSVFSAADSFHDEVEEPEPAEESGAADGDASFQAMVL